MNSIMNFEMIKNLPFLPAKMLDRRSLIPGKITLQGEPGRKIQNQLFSKFSEEVVEALKIVIQVSLSFESFSLFV